MTDTVTRPRRPRRPAGSRNHPVKSSILGAIESGTSVIEELRQEMEDWASNMESNSMEHLPKYDEVNEAKDALESPKDELEGIELPEEIGGVEVEYTQDTRQSAQSRSGRLNNALDELRAAEAGLEEWLEDNEELEFIPEDERDPEEEDMTYPTQEEVDEREGLREKAQEALDTIQNQLSELESVNFPGMY